MHIVGEGPGETPSASLICLAALANKQNALLKTNKQAFFLSPFDVCFKSFLYLYYTLINLGYTKALSSQDSFLSRDQNLLSLSSQILA